eukprot:3953738-Pyramimonas_sp.AAC.1
MLHTLFEYVEGTPPGIQYRMGTFHEQVTPPGLLQYPPPIWLLAMEISTTAFRLSSMDGFIFGGGIRYLHGMAEFSQGVVVAWKSNIREHYYSQEMDPTMPINFWQLVGAAWDNYHFMIFLSKNMYLDTPPEKYE